MPLNMDVHKSARSHTSTYTEQNGSISTLCGRHSVKSRYLENISFTFVQQQTLSFEASIFVTLNLDNFLLHRYIVRNCWTHPYKEELQFSGRKIVLFQTDARAWTLRQKILWLFSSQLCVPLVVIGKFVWISFGKLPIFQLNYMNKNLNLLRNVVRYWKCIIFLCGYWKIVRTTPSP